ncbi:Bgt-20629-2, partial [Blumeria graminis f. sp. tritici]
MPTDLTSYLVEVRHIDAVLRSSDPNYTKSKPVSGTYFPSTLPFSAITSTPIGEPMDLSSATTIPKTTWTAVDAATHRIPQTEAEKCAKRSYCFENKLCSWYYDPGHRARVCAEARWNKDKPRNA